MILLGKCLGVFFLFQKSKTDRNKTRACVFFWKMSGPSEVFYSHSHFEVTAMDALYTFSEDLSCKPVGFFLLPITFLGTPHPKSLFKHLICPFALR